MIFEGWRFRLVARIEPSRMQDGSIQEFMPQSRYENRNGLPRNRHGAGPFCKFTIPGHYRQPGVYLLVTGDEPCYVGECKNLSDRFNKGYGNISPRNCFRGGQETNCRLNHLVYQAARAGDRLTLHFHETTDHKAVEARLRSIHPLPWNRV